jgi:FkbM family methyltransferase
VFARTRLRIRKALAAFATPLSRRALLHGVAASLEHRDVLALLPVKCVVDVGANRGQFAVLCAQLFPDAPLFSFEPASAAYSVLLDVIAGHNVRTTRAAITTRDGPLILNVTAEDDSSSILPVGDYQATLFGTRVVRQESVSAGPLSSFISRHDIQAPALLKIDVQGAELDVVRASADLLDNFAWIYIECSFIELYTGQALAPEIIAYLAQFGFELSGVFNQYVDLTGRAVQADFLFTNRQCGMASY